MCDYAILIRKYYLITVRPLSRHFQNFHSSITLNFYNNIKNLSAILVLCGLLWKFIASTSYYINEMDVYSRAPQSDFYTSVLYFMWTSFWYLPSCILLLILVSVWLRTSSVQLMQLVFATLLLVYSSTLIDYQILNPTCLSLYRGESWNTLLTNSVNKYHPFIFYSTISGVILTYWVITTTTKHTQLIVISNFTNLHNLSQDKLVYIIFTLFLGSWWAAQEGSWGGWWNWDPSEVFGLVVMIFFTQMIHRHRLKYTHYTLWLTIKSFLFTILVLYLFIQLNFDLVSHNFGTKTNQFIDSYQFLLLLLILIVGLWVTQLSTLCTSSALNKVPMLINIQALQSRTILTLILLVVTGLSFTDLLNNFSWSISGTNLLNLPNLSTHYATISVLTLCLLIYKPSITTLPTVYTLSTWFYILPYYILTRVPKSWTSFNHVLITVILWITYFTLNQASTTWFYVTENTQTSFITTLSDLCTTYVSLSNYVIETGHLQSWSNQVTGYGWNIFKDGSVPIVHTFSHPLGSNGQAQGMLSTGSEYTHSTHIIDLFSIYLPYILIVLFVNALTLLTSKPIIIY